MLGLSLGKFLLLAALVLLVWYGVKHMNRIEAVRRAFRDELKRRQTPPKPTRLEAEDLVKCTPCGAYVSARGALNCGRADCPWGR